MGLGGVAWIHYPKGMIPRCIVNPGNAMVQLKLAPHGGGMLCSQSATDVDSFTRAGGRLVMVVARVLDGRHRAVPRLCARRKACVVDPLALCKNPSHQLQLFALCEGRQRSCGGGRQGGLSISKHALCKHAPRSVQTLNVH